MAVHPVLSVPMRLLVLVLAFSAPLLGHEVFRAATERQDALNAARQDVAHLAHTAAARQEQALGEASNLVRVLVRIPAVRRPKEPACHALLREVSNEHSGILRIIVTGAGGVVECTSDDPSPTGLFMADRSWFRDATAADAPATVISDLIVSRSTGRPVVVVAGRVPQSDTSPEEAGTAVVRTVSVALTPEWLPEIAAAIAHHANSSVLIVNGRTGTLLARTQGGSNALGTAFPDHPLLIAARAERGDGVAEVEGFDGVMRVTGFVRLPGDHRDETIVAVGLAREQILQAANARLLGALGLLGGLVLAGVIAAGVAASTLFVRPLARLQALAQALTDGNLDARIDEKALPDGEFRSLARALNGAMRRLQQRDRELSHLALRDGLTGLANRRSFDEALLAEWERAQRSGAPFAVLMVDIDRFKRLNDTAGHAAGDECLRTIARALQGALRFSADMAARYGGEEFAIILPGTGPASARRVAARLVAAVAELGLVNTGSEYGIVTISVGVSFSGLPTSPADLLAAADSALYAAKNTGRNRWVAAETPVAA